MNIGLVVTLTKETRLSPLLFSGNEDEVFNLYSPIEDMCAPTVEQTDEIVEAMNETVVKRGKAVVVHCRAGKGMLLRSLPTYIAIRCKSSPVCVKPHISHATQEEQERSLPVTW